MTPGTAGPGLTVRVVRGSTFWPLQERWGITALHCPYCQGYEVKGQQLGVLSVGPLSTHQALLISDWGPVTFFLNNQAAPDPVTLAKLTQWGVQVEAAS